MTRFLILLGTAVLASGLLACGRFSRSAEPTPPAPVATIVVPGVQSPAPAAAQQPAPASADARTEVALSRAAELPQQLRDAAPLLPPWPTFTPGPAPQSNHRLIFARTRRLYTAKADGSDIQAVKFANSSPQLFGGSYKDPGRGWLSEDGRYLVYFAGQEAQLWLGDLKSLENVQLAARLMPVGGEDDGELIRILTSQELAWTAGGDRVALLGAPESLDLFLIDLAARQVIRLTEDDGYESWPQWSPNGQYLAYKTTDPRTGAQAVFVFDAGTQQSTQVDVEPIRAALELGAGSAFAFVGELIWVSDTRLVFYPQANQRSGGIWLHDVATSVTQDILSDPIDDPAWSAEARAWVYSVPDEPGNLWMLRLDDPKPAQLVKGQAYAPVWSPDGQAIVYSWSNPESIGWDLRVVDLAGNDRTLVPNAALIQRSPSEPGPAGKRYWSPDGQFVVYATIGRDYGRAEQTEGYGGEAGPDLENWWMVSVRGGEPRRMTDMQKAFYLQEPALSPDGTVWAYIGFSYVDRLQHLYTIPLGGGHPERVDAGVRWFGWLP